VAETTEPADTQAPTTVAPAVTGVALTTTVPTTVPTTPAPVATVPAPTTTAKAPTKTVPTTTLKPPVGVPTTTTLVPLPTLAPFVPVILPPVLFNPAPSISSLVASPASVSSCGATVNFSVTITDADGVGSANALVTYLVAGVTRSAGVKLSPLKGTTWGGSLIVSLGDVVNQPATVKVTATDTKGRSGNQTFANKFTVLPCIIG
jgi:hypothetical protein